MLRGQTTNPAPRRRLCFPHITPVFQPTSQKGISLTWQVLWVAFPQALVLAVYLPSLWLRWKTQISKPFWPSGKGKMSWGRGSHRISLTLLLSPWTYSICKHVHLQIQFRHRLEEDIKRERTYKNYPKFLPPFLPSKNGSQFSVLKENSIWVVLKASWRYKNSKRLFWTTNT